MYDVVRILLIWMLCFLSVLLHELSHALGYRISGGTKEWKIRAGSGPRILSTSKFIFYLFPVGGYFDPHEEMRTKKAKLLTLAGGPIMSMLLTALFYACYFCFSRFMDPESTLCTVLSPAFRFLMFFNFFQFLFTAIPMHYRIICRGLESDGLQIVHVLKNKKA